MCLFVGGDWLVVDCIDEEKEANILFIMMCSPVNYGVLNMYMFFVSVSCAVCSDNCYRLMIYGQAWVCNSSPSLNKSLRLY